MGKYLSRGGITGNHILMATVMRVDVVVIVGDHNELEGGDTGKF